MTINNQNLIFDKLCKDDQIPYELLLLADPSKELIDEYLKTSDVYTAKQNDEILGIAVLFPLSTGTVEIDQLPILVVGPMHVANLKKH